jgi:Immunity protein 26
MNKRQHLTIGAFVKIPLESGYFAFARILPKGNMAIYDLRTQDESPDLHFIASQPVLFIVAVYADAVSKGRWQKIGKIPIPDSMNALPFKFMQDHFTGSIDLYDTNTGKITPASKEEIAGLERAAVWEAEHVEERIRDHYNGVPNIWVERLKIE